MFEFEFYNDFALHEILRSLFKCMTFSYASGRRCLRVYMQSAHSYCCVDGWVRGLGPDAYCDRNWLGSKGIYACRMLFSPKLFLGEILLQRQIVRSLICLRRHMRLEICLVSYASDFPFLSEYISGFYT